jgi:hypothetical protein
MHAAIHPLTPGSPAYALAKLGAVGGLFALKMALSRRAQHRAQSDSDQDPMQEHLARPHPVSRRKAQRRRKRR